MTASPIFCLISYGQTPSSRRSASILEFRYVERAWMGSSSLLYRPRLQRYERIVSESSGAKICHSAPTTAIPLAVEYTRMLTAPVASRCMGVDPDSSRSEEAMYILGPGLREQVISILSPNLTRTYLGLVSKTILLVVNQASEQRGYGIRCMLCKREKGPRP